jgi:hypothetical protein
MDPPARIANCPLESHVGHTLIAVEVISLEGGWRITSEEAIATGHSDATHIPDRPFGRDEPRYDG